MGKYIDNHCQSAYIYFQAAYPAIRRSGKETTMLTATRNEILEALALHAGTVIACRVVLESTDRLTLQSELRIEAGSAASHAEWLARNFTVEG